MSYIRKRLERFCVYEKANPIRRPVVRLRAMPVEFQNPGERLLELLIGQRVAERVDRTVEIAEPIGDIVERVESTD